MDLKDIPIDVDNEKKNVTIQEKYVAVTSNDGSYQTKVYYQEALPGRMNVKLCVLLLHGMRFTSQTWRDLGTIDLLSVIGYRVVAVDLPGYGKSIDAKSENTGEFLVRFIDCIQLDDVIIVSPSMSGMYSIPLMMNKGLSFTIKGFVPVAPIHTDEYTEEDYTNCTVPTLIVYGENDTTAPGIASKRDLKYLPNHTILIFQNAGHACYLEDPDLWHKAIYSFISQLH